jgi:DNA-binding response OmpR family regulator
MERPLAGRLILIAEDEPLIAIDITQAFEDEGASVIMAHTLDDALREVEDPALSAAILDHALSDGDSSTVCKRMKERNIPFVTYSGYDALGGVCREGVHLKKPASMALLVATVKGLLSERQISTQMTNWRALIDYACAQSSASPLLKAWSSAELERYLKTKKHSETARAACATSPSQGGLHDPTSPERALNKDPHPPALR